MGGAPGMSDPWSTNFDQFHAPLNDSAAQRDLRARTRAPLLRGHGYRIRAHHLQPPSREPSARRYDDSLRRSFAPRPPSGRGSCDPPRVQPIPPGYELAVADDPRGILDLRGDDLHLQLAVHGTIARSSSGGRAEI